MAKKYVGTPKPKKYVGKPSKKEPYNPLKRGKMV